MYVFLNLPVVSPTELADDIAHAHPLPWSGATIKALNSELDALDVDTVLKWLHTNIPDSLVQMTSFGPSGLVILDKLSKLGLLAATPVYTVDTLHLFPETYAFVESLKAFYPEMDLKVVQPLGMASNAQFDDKYGADLWQKDPDRYAYLSKVEPMLVALNNSRVYTWMTGRRRSQGGERKDLPILELDAVITGKLKANPLASWDYPRVWSYLRSHHIPFNPLHDKGFKSIGDVMTTRAVPPGGSERSGRFHGLNKTECGMHTQLAKAQARRQQALQENAEEEFEMPTLPCTACLNVETDTFEALVLDAGQDLLMEFYSPMCGHCQSFAPSYAQIATQLSPFQQLGVARMDSITYKVPPAGLGAGFNIDGVPSMYLVLARTPDRPRTLLKYSGQTEVGPIVQWLKGHLPYLEAFEPALD